MGRKKLTRPSRTFLEGEVNRLYVALDAATEREQKQTDLIERLTRKVHQLEIGVLRKTAEMPPVVSIDVRALMATIRAEVGAIAVDAVKSAKTRSVR